MEQITVSVQYKIKKKKLVKATSAIFEYVEAVKKNEPGTTEYKVFQDQSDHTVFIHIMSFVDKTAKKTHEKSEHLKKLKKILAPMSKGKAVYTNMITLQSPILAENVSFKENMPSHEPI